MGDFFLSSRDQNAWLWCSVHPQHTGTWPRTGTQCRSDGHGALGYHIWYLTQTPALPACQTLVLTCAEDRSPKLHSSRSRSGHLVWGYRDGISAVGSDVCSAQIGKAYEQSRRRVLSWGIPPVHFTEGFCGLTQPRIMSKAQICSVDGLQQPKGHLTWAANLFLNHSPGKSLNNHTYSVWKWPWRYIHWIKITISE